MKHHVGSSLLAVIFTLIACTSLGGVAPPESAPRTLTVYSGRSEELIGPLIETFESETGIRVNVRYGETAEMAATILEEGANSPADVFLAQDAGALGALAQAGLAAKLPDEILTQVKSRFRSPAGLWVGISGRARVVAYNTTRLTQDGLPASIWGFTDPAWKGRIGWPPTNGSFQAFITAFRVVEGDQAAREWLEGIIANDPVSYPSNNTALEGVASGEVDVAFINHYYLFRQLADNPDYPVANYFLPGGDIGSLVNVAGVAMLSNAAHPQEALLFVEFLLSEQAQSYFRDNTYEYPLVAGIEADPRLPPLDSIATPAIDLSNLADLEGTLKLLREVGALE